MNTCCFNIFAYDLYATGEVVGERAIAEHI